MGPCWWLQIAADAVLEFLDAAAATAVQPHCVCASCCAASSAAAAVAATAALAKRQVLSRYCEIAAAARATAAAQNVFTGLACTAGEDLYEALESADAAPAGVAAGAAVV